MEFAINEVFENYGIEIQHRKGQGMLVFRGLFQPVRSKSWQYLEGNYSPLGEVPRGQFVYMGPSMVKMNVGDTIRVKDKDYMLRRIEPVYYQDRVAYYWGMCVEKGGADTWGQS